MNKTTKVLTSILIIFLLALCTALYMDVREHRKSYDEYRNTLLLLNSSIDSLKDKLSQYQSRMEELNAERDTLRKEIHLIFKDNEKIDAYLANGDWDYNIRFLTDFLSSEDSVPERYRLGNHEGSVSEDKQVTE